MKNKKEKQNKSDCPGYYEVSGYTTGDGKKVDSYTRTCWKHGNGIVSDSVNKNGNFYKNNENPTEETPSPTQDTPPTDDGEKSKRDKRKEEIQEIINILINNLDKMHYSDVPLSPYNPIQRNYREYRFGNNNNQTFSTFDLKSTKEKIKESTNSVEEILKQKQINDSDINNIEAKTRQSISSIFDDVEDLSAKKSNLPKMITVESVKQEQEIENSRKQAREDASNAIIMLNLAKNALDKQWKHVNKRDENFDEKFDQYTKKKAEIEKLSKNVFDLFYAIPSIDENTSEKIKKLRDEIGLMRTRPKLAPKSNQKWIWPCEGPITSGYGKRKAPVPGASEFHNGWDIGVSEGTPIKAIADGKIIAVGKARGYGNWIVIDHGIINGINVTSEYGHISSWNVKYGQIIKQGDIIAKSGNTGYSSGAHLHITIREGKFPGIAIDPRKYIKFYF